MSCQRCHRLICQCPPPIIVDNSERIAALEQQVAAQQAQMYEDRRQALVWRDQVAALTTENRNYQVAVVEKNLQIDTPTKELEQLCLHLAEVSSQSLLRIYSAQAREAKLREALEHVHDLLGDYGGHSCVAEEVLALPADDSALKERLKAEREKCAKLVDSCWDDSCCLEESPMLHNLAAAIRGLA